MMNFLKTIADASGENVDLFSMTTLFNCPALPLFLRTYAEIIEKKFANPNITWDVNNRVVWAVKGTSIVGGICYEFDMQKRTGWIVLSFVDESQRGKRIYELLHQAMEDDLLAIGARSLASLVHVNNESRLKSAQRVGINPQFYRMHKPLKKT